MGSLLRVICQVQTVLWEQFFWKMSRVIIRENRKSAKSGTF